MPRGRNRAETPDHSAHAPAIDSPRDFQKAIRTSGTATTEVATDSRVFERITLGLYREPASAIRELVSNAYDADASKVTITTNPPHFNEVTVEDDGIGMSAKVVDYLVHHVGGSLKRLSEGAAAGVTRAIGTSPGGRRLIGQMGIGLYSVARLSRRITIETKQRGDDHRFLIEIDLSGLDPENLPTDEAERYVAGYAKVSRKRVHLADVKNHYTRIQLHDILAEARRIMQSSDRWEQYFAKAGIHQRGELKYHIGREAPLTQPSVPWTSRDSAQQRFGKLVDALSTRVESAESSPSLDQTLDYYLAMLWKISLSAPLKYVEQHPFSLTNKSCIEFYNLNSEGTPEIVALADGVTIGDHLGIREVGAPPSPFTVVIDGIELRRPIIFRPFSASDPRKLLRRPKMFIGKIGSEAGGANLSGTGYFFWSYNIIPKENNGLLVRIAGASGTLFDPRFLAFRTSENLRLRQVSGEVFIERGLENALNVDRESFVETDPSVRALQRWAHRSMTRLFSRLKADQKTVAAERKATQRSEKSEKAEREAAKIWASRRGRRGSPPPKVIVTSKPPSLDTPADALVVTDIVSDRRGGVESEPIVPVLRAILLVLDAHGVLDELEERERGALISDIRSILQSVLT